MDQATWQAIVHRDRGLDGEFYYAVTSTGIYCRPSCPARRPKPENVRIFEDRAAAEKAGFRACLRCRPDAPDANPVDAITRVCRYLDEYYDASPSLETLAKVAKMSRFHLARTFKGATGMTIGAYAQLCRMNALKKKLKTSDSVTTAMYDAGFGSASRLYEQSNAKLGMTPRAYRNGGLGETIRYTVVPSPVGRMMVAATTKGICALQLGKEDRELERELKAEFPFAELQRDPAPPLEWLDALDRHLQGTAPNPDLPLDLRGTVFQKRVWEALQRIPYGQTRTYSQVAKELGEPNATRAVARACATNKVSVIVPCHRVLRRDGSLGGYRWGLSRKVQLLQAERAAAGD